MTIDSRPVDEEIHYLIFHQECCTHGEFKVWVDSALDLDWWCDDASEKRLQAPESRKTLTRIRTGVAELEPIAQNWPKDLKLVAKRILGEALVSALHEDSSGADHALISAQKFYRTKSRQVSRYWILQGCLTTAGIAAFLGVIQLLSRSWIMKLAGETAYLVSMCFWAGCIGALMFVLLRLGKQPQVDSTAQKHLHYLEALSRIVGGGIAGMLLGGTVKLGLIVPIFAQGNLQTLAMWVLAMVAGASERLAAGIVTKVENGETRSDEVSNDNN